MAQIRETAGGLVYREEPLSILARLFAATIGLSMFVGGAIFASLGRWMPPAWTDVIALVAILAFAAVGVVGLLIAFCGRKTLDFDGERRTIARRVVAPIGRWRDEIPFDRVTGVELHVRQTEDGPFPLVRLRVADERRPVELAGFDTPDEADRWRERIAALVRSGRSDMQTGETRP
jgi:hypothetical protein